VILLGARLNDRRQVLVSASDNYFSLLLPHDECYRPVIS